MLLGVVRALFAGWILFEFLNWIGVFNVPLEFTWSGLLITSLIVWGGLELISRGLKKATSKPLAWYALLGGLAGVSIDAIGDIALLYGRYGWYDQIAHAFGGGMAGLVIVSVLWQLIQADRLRMGTWWHWLVSVAIVSLLGVAYELEEYLEDVFTGSNRLGTGPDTANDMMWNLIGGLVVISLFIWRTRKKHA